MFSTDEYRNILKKFLQDRKKANHRYSMRAFALDIGISANQLSRILNHRQGLSYRKAMQIAERLKMTEEEKEIFGLMVIASDGRSKYERSKAQKKLDQFKEDVKTDELIEKHMTLSLNQAVFEEIEKKMSDFQIDLKNWINQKPVDSRGLEYRLSMTLLPVKG